MAAGEESPGSAEHRTSEREMSAKV